VEDRVGQFSARDHDVTYFITPWTRQKAFWNWIGRDLNFYPQTGNDLGQRMCHAINLSFRRGMKRTVLIGSDIPLLSNSIIDQAFEALETHDCVLGPACDGGYYLIGFKSETFTPAVFESISWSTDQVLAQTHHVLKSHNRTVHCLEELYDIDRLDDLHRLKNDIRCQQVNCEKTADFLSTLND
jgi:rSAM/selenodomain-associated transferase 1